MKKLLSLTAITILSSTTVSNLTNTSINANHLHNFESINDNKSNPKINWNNVKANIDNIFENYRKKSQMLQLKLLKKSSNKVAITAADINKALKLAQAKSNEYFANFKNKSLNLNQVIGSLTTDNIKFKSCYDKNLNDIKNVIRTNLKLNRNKN